jgi:small conductance mechanosensitive channel
MPPVTLTPPQAEILGAVLRVALIALFIFLADRGLRLAAQRVARRLEESDADAEQVARLRTLLRVGRSTIYVLILLIAAMMALYTFGINVTPLLASAGVAGLAISLGAQTLFRDIIGGIIILFESQYAIGDTIRVGAVEGTVERITLRATWLRDAGGQLHIVPNGDIRVVSNLTKARAVVDLNVPLDADFGRTLTALEGAMQQAERDPALAAVLSGPPRILGWSGVTDTAVQVRLVADAEPGKQMEVARGLRRYALEALRVERQRVQAPGLAPADTFE